MYQIRKRAILLLNAMLRERIAEQERLCARLPQYAYERTLPDGTVAKGGLLEDLEVLRYAEQPNINHPDPQERKKTLVDDRDPLAQFIDFASATGTNSIAEIVVESTDAR